MITTRLSSLCLRTSSINVSINSFISTSPLVAARRWKEKSEPKFTFEFSNPVREMVGMKMTINAPPPEKGVTYDNRLMKVTVKEGCGYTWCGCGMARTEQPFCDLTCQNIYMKRIIKNQKFSEFKNQFNDSNYSRVSDNLGAGGQWLSCRSHGIYFPNSFLFSRLCTY